MSRVIVVEENETWMFAMMVVVVMVVVSCKIDVHYKKCESRCGGDILHSGDALR